MISQRYMWYQFSPWKIPWHQFSLWNIFDINLVFEYACDIILLLERCMWYLFDPFFSINSWTYLMSQASFKNQSDIICIFQELNWCKIFLTKLMSHVSLRDQIASFVLYFFLHLFLLITVLTEYSLCCCQN